jgi:hypothetical protein
VEIGGAKTFPDLLTRNFRQTRDPWLSAICHQFVNSPEILLPGIAPNAALQNSADPRAGRAELHGYRSRSFMSVKSSMH